MTKLRISEDLAFPIDVVTQTIGIVAKRRAGKSFLARRLTEQLFKAGQQVVVIDPKGDWWGIRSARDGRGPGLPILIIGGEHGDIPLEAGSGEVVAKLVVEEQVSALLDLSSFRKHEAATFSAAFLETLYRLKNHERYRTPLMLLIDEADAIAPQKPMPNEARMLGALEDVVRRGGQRGLGCTFITQRTAVLNKNVLTQAQILIALRTIAPQDLAAMNAWIDVHGEPEQRKTLMDSLPSLPIGDAWVWSPGWPNDKGIFQRIHTAPIETFDSGATPKPGQKRIEPKSLADVDLEAVRRQMAQTLERAKADDPRELRKRIAELERQGAELQKQLKARAAPTEPKEKRVEVPAISAKQLAMLDAALCKSRDQVDAAMAVAKVLDDCVFKAVQARLAPTERPPTSATHTVVRAGGVPAGIAEQRRPVPRPAAQRPPPTTSNGSSALPKGEAITLTAIAQYRNGVTREQLTVVTGYKRSTRDAYLQRLRERGYVQAAGDRLLATDAGVAALPADFEPLPTGEALRAHWLSKLPEGERRVLEVVLPAWPEAVDRAQIGELTGYKRSTRDAYLQRLRMRQVVETIGSGVKGSDLLFEEAR